MAFMCSGKKCSFVYSVFVLTAMVGVLWFIWFGTDTLLGKEETENNLGQLSEQLTSIGNDYGKNIKITHGMIEAESWAVNKRTVVRNLNIEVTGKNAGDLTNFKLALGDVVTYTDQYNPQKLVIETSNSINIYQNEIFLSALVFSEPLVYNYQQSKIDNSQPFQHNIILPKNIALTTVNNDVMAEEKDGGISVDGEEKFSLSFTVNPTIELVATTSELHSLSYDFSGLTAVSKGEKIISFGILNSQFNEEDGDDEGKRAGKYNFIADDVVIYKDAAFTKPYSFNINTNLVFDTISKDSKEPATDMSSADALKSQFYNGATRNREVTLNNVTISNPDFQLRATGNFINTVGDPLPSGEVKIDIDHIQAFLASEIVAMQGKDLISGALTKIVGQPLDDQDQTSFVLKREKNGVFYVGKTTFEELVASMLTGGMIGHPSSSGGRLPDAQLPVRPPVTNDSDENKPGDGTNATPPQTPITNP